MLKRIDDENIQMGLIDNGVVDSTEKFREERDYYKKLLEKEKEIAKKIEEEKKIIKDMAMAMAMPIVERYRIENDHVVEQLKDTFIQRLKGIDDKIVDSAEKFSEKRDDYEKPLEEGKEVWAMAMVNLIVEGSKSEEGRETKRNEYFIGREKYEDDMENLRAMLSEINKAHETLVNNFKWGSTIAIWLSIAIVSALVWTQWNGLELRIKNLFVCVAFFSVLMALAIPLGWKKIYKIIAIIGAVAGIIGIIIYFVTDHLA